MKEKMKYPNPIQHTIITREAQHIDVTDIDIRKNTDND